MCFSFVRLVSGFHGLLVGMNFDGMPLFFGGQGDAFAHMRKYGYV